MAKTWNVKTFPNGTVANDGQSVTIDVVMEDGHEAKMKMPYDQLEWLVQALLRLSAGAFERNVALGRLPSAHHVDDTQTMITEGFRVLPNDQTQMILVQMVARPAEGLPLGAGSFMAKPELMADLATRLTNAIEALRQKAQPN